MIEKKESALEEKEAIETYVESIYIYDQSGMCLTSYGKKLENFDVNIVSGFFTAMQKFSQKLIPGTRIRCLIMSGYKLFYDDNENITFCVICYDDLPNRVIEYILNEISDNFLKMYRDYIPVKDGNITIFSKFNTYLSKFMDKPLIESLLEDFGYKIFSEGVILFDQSKEEILFAKVPVKFSSRKQISMGGMLINFANKISNEFEGGDVNSILISSDNKWICVAKKENIYIIVLFSRVKAFEINVIIEKTEEILENTLNMLKIGTKV